MMSIAARRKDHYQLSTNLSLLSDQQLISIIRREKSTQGWGTNRIVTLGGRKVFVKQIAVTELEMSKPYSTKNLFRIPTFYNYGVGSAGFGAFRELAGHVKTTNWVLGGQIEHFPLLHHHRIVRMDAVPGPNDDDAKARFRSYLKGWNSSKAIEKFLVQRSESKYQLLLFIEHIPFQAAEWLPNNPRKTERLFSQVLNTVEFMSANNMVHFDAHAQNWLTDGETFFLTDFGLVADKSFESSEVEQKFLTRHKYYDYAQAIHTISNGVVMSLFALSSEKRQRVVTELNLDLQDWQQLSQRLAANALRLEQRGMMKLPPFLARHMAKHQKVIDTQAQFFTEISANPRKDTPYPHTRIRRYLKSAGLVD